MTSGRFGLVLCLAQQIGILKFFELAEADAIRLRGARDMVLPGNDPASVGRTPQNPWEPELFLVSGQPRVRRNL